MLEIFCTNVLNCFFFPVQVSIQHMAGFMYSVLRQQEARQTHKRSSLSHKWYLFLYKVSKLHAKLRRVSKLWQSLARPQSVSLESLSVLRLCQSWVSVVASVVLPDGAQGPSWIVVGGACTWPPVQQQVVHAPVDHICHSKEVTSHRYSNIQQCPCISCTETTY